jgi:hypothetical protein
MNVTGWYAPWIEPVREGVYQLYNTSTDMIFYARWIKQGWCIGMLTAGSCELSWKLSVVQNRWPWRGLAEQPK